MTNKKVLISIIVPVYKAEKYIDNCVNSIKKQTYTNWELILVDDGSPDNSPKLCDDYSRSNERIKTIHLENGGASKARNKGVAISKGEYITFLDSDDFLHPVFLEYMLQLCIDHDAEISQSGFMRGTDTIFPEMKESEQVEKYSNRDIFLSQRAKIIMPAKLYKRHLLEENKITEGRKFEDDFSTWKWYYHAKDIVVSNKKLYYYTINNDSTMSRYVTKPNYEFFDAYRERTEFFINRGDKELEDMTRIHFCKSLLLNYGNKCITEAEKKKIYELFKVNFIKIHNKNLCGIKLRLLFHCFFLIPSSTSSVVKKVKS